MVKTRLILFALLLSCSTLPDALEPGKSLVTCDANDRAAEIDLAANAAKSKVDRAHCRGDEACIQDVLDARDKYVDERCKLPESQ